MCNCLKTVKAGMEKLEENCPILKVSFYYLIDLSFKYFLVVFHLSSFFTPGDFVQMPGSLLRPMPSKPAAGKPRPLLQLGNAAAASALHQCLPLRLCVGWRIRHGSLNKSIDMLRKHQELSL